MEVKTSSDLYEEWLFGGVEVMGNGKRPPAGFLHRLAWVVPTEVFSSPFIMSESDTYILRSIFLVGRFSVYILTRRWFWRWLVGGYSWLYCGISTIHCMRNVLEYKKRCVFVHTWWSRWTSAWGFSREHSSLVTWLYHCTVCGYCAIVRIFFLYLGHQRWSIRSLRV